MHIIHDGVLEFFVNGKHQEIAAERIYQRGYDIYAVVDHCANCHESVKAKKLGRLYRHC